MQNVPKATGSRSIPVRTRSAKERIVEAGVKYIKGSFLPLREFRDLDDANRQLQAWVMNEAGNRIHGTTREAPLKRFVEVEKGLLIALPSVRLNWQAGPRCWFTATRMSNTRPTTIRCRSG